MENNPGSVAAISVRLFAEFNRLLPLAVPEKRKGKSRLASPEAALKQFFTSAAAERRQHGLGIIGRARVAFALQQKLLAAGYPAPLVKQVLFAMLASAFVGKSGE